MNIITDLALVLLPVPTVWKIQIPAPEKAFVLGLFATRIV